MVNVSERRLCQVQHFVDRSDFPSAHTLNVTVAVFGCLRSQFCGARTSAFIMLPVEAFSQFLRGGARSS